MFVHFHAPHPTSEAAPRRPACPRCAAAVAHLPPIARFCHRCGARLRDGAAAKAVPAVADGLPAPFAAVFPPSLILLAYGKALFKLGLRYETAFGSRRNVEESMRCYHKAARLGDASAIERLAAGGATPPPLPPAPLPVASSVTPPPPFAGVHCPPES